MIVIIPKTNEGYDQIEKTKQLINTMNQKGVIWEKKRSSYPRLLSSNKRGEPAKKELMRVIYEGFPPFTNSCLHSYLFNYLCVVREVAGEDYNKYDNFDKTLCLVNNNDDNSFPMESNDDYYILHKPSMDLISQKLLEYYDIVNENEIVEIDKVFCIKSKIEQFELSLEEKVELIKFLIN